MSVNNCLTVTAKTVYFSYFVITTLYLFLVASPNNAFAIEACDRKSALEVDGQRRMALIIGVGKYPDKDIKNLVGPASDARLFYHLLTDKNGGYNFPKQNVCVLIDSTATKKNVLLKFEQLLVKRARPQDIAVMYFAGHGSQIRDKNNDEYDKLDETLVLYDSIAKPPYNQLIDNELNEMFATLHKKTKNIVFIADSCNSNTIMREGITSLTRRYNISKDSNSRDIVAANNSSRIKADNEKSIVAKELPGMVILSAAGDGASAFERYGKGLFTQALITVLSPVNTKTLTYQEALVQMRPLLAASSKQIPMFHGDINKAVFNSTKRRRPFALSVIKAGKNIVLQGPPLPGLGVNAVLRVYRVAATDRDTADKNNAIAKIVVDSSNQINTKAHVSEYGPRLCNNKMCDIKEGDYAVLITPAEKYIVIKVSLEKTSRKGGIPKNLAKEIRTTIKADKKFSSLVKIVNNKTAANFKLIMNRYGKIQLHDAENLPLIIYQEMGSNKNKAEEIVWNLRQHAIQAALKQLRAEGGKDFDIQKSLQIKLIPVAESKQQSCIVPNSWVQAKINEKQVIPLCYDYQIQVTSKANKNLLIGALVLSSDGHIFVASDGINESLHPGESRVLQGVFYGKPPFNVQETIMVIGTQEDSPIPWEIYASDHHTATQASRNIGKSTNPLFQTIDSYLNPGDANTTRTGMRKKAADTSWTMSTVTTQVQANSQFKVKDPTSKTVDQRELSLAQFDIRPYLSDKQDSTLNKLLQQAQNLAVTAAEKGLDGVNYKQHDWKQKSDKANLAKGIDCSRAIWFAFTRAGLVYNKKNKYISTIDMIGKKSLMNDQFDSYSCSATQKIGDILVYRDKNNKSGHTVMVIDAARRFAWGSHGYDSGPKLKRRKKMDRGVEFQKIKSHKDWLYYDRKDMLLKACWRYKKIAKELTTIEGRPGLNAIQHACDTKCKIPKIIQSKSRY